VVEEKEITGKKIPWTATLWMEGDDNDM